MRGNLSRLTSKSEGRITKKQLESDWKSLKQKMQANGFTPAEIREFHNETYRASMKKSKKKRRSSKKKKKSKRRKK
jgi:acetoin utilization deacetylase AcuC-like enzyme